MLFGWFVVWGPPSAVIAFMLGYLAFKLCFAAMKKECKSSAAIEFVKLGQKEISTKVAAISIVCVFVVPVALLIIFELIWGDGPDQRYQDEWKRFQETRQQQPDITSPSPGEPAAAVSVSP